MSIFTNEQEFLFVCFVFRLLNYSDETPTLLGGGHSTFTGGRAMPPLPPSGYGPASKTTTTISAALPTLPICFPNARRSYGPIWTIQWMCRYFQFSPLDWAHDLLEMRCQGIDIANTVYPH